MSGFAESTENTDDANVTSHGSIKVEKMRRVCRLLMNTKKRKGSKTTEGTKERQGDTRRKWRRRPGRKSRK